MKLVIFDMDGLLIDSEKVYAEGWKKGLRDKNFEVDDELIETMSGQNIKKNNQTIFEIVKDMDLVYEIREIREQYFVDQLNENKIGLMYYALEIINKLKESNMKVALATTSYKPRVMQILTSNNIENEFDYICCGDEVENVKPSPDIYLNVVSKSGVKKSEVLALEDSVTGAKAAIAAGISVAIVSKYIAKNPNLVDGMGIIGIYSTLEDFFNDYMKEGKAS